jgi:hypothetical protein
VLLVAGYQENQVRFQLQFRTAQRERREHLRKRTIVNLCSLATHPSIALCRVEDQQTAQQGRSGMTTPRRLTGRGVVVTGGSVRLADQIPARTLFQCCKVRIILVRRVTGLPGCWVAVMFNHLFYLGSRLGLTGCNQRAGPRSGSLCPS